MASPDRLPELVRDSRLRTEINGIQTIHTRPTARRSLSKREIWTLEGIVGQGGGGTVLLQRQSEGSNVGRQRAVKRIQFNTGVSRNPMSSIRRFIRELEASAKFSQERYEEYFVKSYGWYHTVDEIYIAMEYCKLGDLGRYLRQKGTIPEDEVKDVIHQVVTALTMMHDEGFAHRDLKPSNILVVSKPPDGEWWVKLCDLGLSRRSSDASGSTTMMGTPQYMASETIGGRFSGDPTVADPTKADMWCVGETLFQALTGSRTFDDETLHRYQKSLAPFPVSKLESLSISQNGIDLISSLMAPNPRERPDARQALGHAWMPAEADSFIGHEDDSAFLSNYDRPISSSAANFALSDQLTQASAQWTATSPIPHLTNTTTQGSGKWTATIENPSRSAVSTLNEVALRSPGQTNLGGLSPVSNAMKLLDTSSVHQASNGNRHDRSASNISGEVGTVAEIDEDNAEGESEKEQETARLGNESKREAEELEQNVRDEKQEFRGEVKHSAKNGSQKGSVPLQDFRQVDLDLLDSFKQFSAAEKLRLAERQRALAQSNRSPGTLDELKKFSQNFKLSTPIPPDLIPILTVDEQQQRRIRSKALLQSQEAKAAENEQSRLAASSPSDKARKDISTPPRDWMDQTTPITQRADISQGRQNTYSNPPKPMTWAERAAAANGSLRIAPADSELEGMATGLTQSDTASVAESHSPAPTSRRKSKKERAGKKIPAPILHETPYRAGQK